MGKVYLRMTSAMLSKEREGMEGCRRGSLPVPDWLLESQLLVKLAAHKGTLEVYFDLVTDLDD
jgi:hypothetical protein